MNRDVIIACDFSSRKELNDFLVQFEGESPYLKIGMELYYAEGPNLVKELKEKGFKIFLDLKLHDIPTTVRKAMKNLAKLGVDIVNLHAAGGSVMMQEAIKGLEEGAPNGKRPLCIAVTQLTSTSKEVMNDELLIPGEVHEVVRSYAQLTKTAGLDGVVCSVHEAPIIKELGIVSVTPGIRFSDNSVDDQKRVATPALAKELGSTFIVVGRAITAATNPLEAYKKCINEFI